MIKKPRTNENSGSADAWLDLCSTLKKLIVDGIHFSPQIMTDNPVAILSLIYTGEDILPVHWILRDYR